MFHEHTICISIFHLSIHVWFITDSTLTSVYVAIFLRVFRKQFDLETLAHFSFFLPVLIFLCYRLDYSFTCEKYVPAFVIMHVYRSFALKGIFPFKAVIFGAIFGIKYFLQTKNRF